MEFVLYRQIQFAVSTSKAEPKFVISVAQV